MSNEKTPVAYLHQVVCGDGEPDQALSFEPDNFPLSGVLGYRSLSHEPLFRAEPSNELERLRAALWQCFTDAGGDTDGKTDAACRAAMPDAPTFMGEPVIDDVYTAELVELDGHTYGLRPNAARVVKEAMRDAGRYRWLRGTIFLAAVDGYENSYRREKLDAFIDNAIDTDMRKTP